MKRYYYIVVTNITAQTFIRNKLVERGYIEKDEIYSKGDIKVDVIISGDIPYLLENEGKVCTKDWFYSNVEDLEW